MSKQFWIALVVIVAAICGIYFVTSHKTGNDKSSSTIGQPSSNITGNKSSGVKLVEYGDFQCPSCGFYYPATTQAVEKYKDQISFQFVNFPLINLHPNAFAASRAAEAASMQGKFWEMYAKLYEQNVSYYNSNQTASTWINSSNPLSFFTQFAKDLGLNTKQFQQDYASSKVNGIINADKAKGDKLNIEGTPTFFLNGKKLNNQDLLGSNNTPSLDKYSKLIDAAIAAQAKTKPSTDTAKPSE